MGRKSSEAIILRARPVGEADLLVTFLTQSEGKIAGSARSARKSRRRFGGALEPMTRGRAQWTETESRELVRLESFETLVSFAARQAQLPWFYLFAYLAEVADTFARDREPDPRFYRLLRAATDASDAGVSVGSVRRWFETWTLRLQGLLPDFERCLRCAAPLRTGAIVVMIEAGEALCAACAASVRGTDIARLSEAEASWLRLALVRPITRMPDPGQVAGVDRLIRALFVQFTGGPFRTARFLEAR